MLTKVNDVIFQCFLRHSYQFKPHKFSIVFMTCTCVPHFEKGSATHVLPNIIRSNVWQTRHKCGMKKMPVRNYNGHF